MRRSKLSGLVRTVDAGIGRVLLTVLVAAIAAASTAPFIAPPTVVAEPVTATALVLEVVDGDTIDIRDDNRGPLRVRVLGIDTPETKKPGYTVGCWGPEATGFAKSTLLGQRVAFIPDPTQDRTDRYGRTLAYVVRADGWDYSVEAARAGAARSYVYGGVPVSRHDAIAAAEKEARDARRGLWGPPCNGETASIVATGSASPPPAPPASQPAPPPAFFEPVPPGAAAMPSPNAYYRDCDAARAAGAAPIRVGEAGYRSDLDRDGDGTACDSWPKFSRLPRSRTSRRCRRRTSPRCRRLKSACNGSGIS
jgi:endonuclease YncB( thermonuclease family)